MQTSMTSTGTHKVAWRWTPLGSAVLSFALILSLASQRVLGSSDDSPLPADLTLYEAMKAVVAEISEDLPVQVDDETVLETLDISTESLVYGYQLLPREGKSRSMWRDQLDGRADAIQSANCLNSVVVAMLAAGLEVRFEYSLAHDLVWVNSLRGDACAADRAKNIPSA